METEWYFVGLALAGFVAFLRHVLIRRAGWSKRRSSEIALLLPSLLFLILTILSLMTDGISEYGLALLAIPIMLGGVFFASIIGLAFATLLDLWPRFED